MTITEKISDLPGLVRHLFPAATVEGGGRRLRCGDLHGAPGGSFVIDAQTGRWKEFAGGEKGDLVDLLAARGCGRGAGDVYRWLDDNWWLDGAGRRVAPSPASRGAAAPAPSGRRLLPAPAGAGPPTPEQMDALAAHHGLAQDAPPVAYLYRLADGRPLLCLVRYSCGGRKRPSRWSWDGVRWRP